MNEVSALNVMQPLMSRDDVCRIVNSVTFLFDHVYLNAGFQLDPQLSSADREYVTRRLSEMIEMGMVRLWNVETLEVERPEFLRTKECNVLSEGEYIQLYEAAHVKLFEMRHDMFGETRQNFDGITELINGKQACFHLALANKFNASGIVHDRGTIQNYGSFLKSGAPSSSIADCLAAEIASISKLPDLASLPMKNIVNARRHLGDFRLKFAELSRSKDTIELSNVEFDRLALEAVTKIISEYQSIKNEIPPERKRWAYRSWRLIFGAKGYQLSSDVHAPFRLLLELEELNGPR